MGRGGGAGRGIGCRGGGGGLVRAQLDGLILMVVGRWIIAGFLIVDGGVPLTAGQGMLTSIIPVASWISVVRDYGRMIAVVADRMILPAPVHGVSVPGGSLSTMC
jgi:hypothetical protein